VYTDRIIYLKVKEEPVIYLKVKEEPVSILSVQGYRPTSQYEDYDPRTAQYNQRNL